MYSKSAGTASAIDAQPLIGANVSGATFPLPQGAGLGGSTTGATHAMQTVDFPKYVVCGYLKSDGQGNQYDYGYLGTDPGFFYVGAQVDLTGRGWQGFAAITHPDNNLGTTTVTTYNQPFPLTLTAGTSTITRTADASLIQQTAITYVPPAAGANIQSVLVQEVQTSFFNFALSGSTPDSVHTRSYTYDDYGNAATISDSSNEDGAVPLYTFDTYDNDPDSWRFGYLKESKRTADSAGQVLLGWEQKNYDSATQNVLSHEVWNDQSQQWLLTSFEYDEYGNRTSKTDPSGATTTHTFDPQYHSFMVQSLSPTNQDGARIVIHFITTVHSACSRRERCPRSTRIRTLARSCSSRRSTGSGGSSTRSASIRRTPHDAGHAELDLGQ